MKLLSMTWRGGLGGVILHPPPRRATDRDREWRRLSPEVAGDRMMAEPARAKAAAARVTTRLFEVGCRRLLLPLLPLELRNWCCLL